MSTPPQHLSGRTLAPGALLALLVTSASLFALAVVIAVGPDGPARLWLDGGGSTVVLKPGAAGSGAVRLADGPAGLLPGGSSGVVSGVTLGSPVAAADRPEAVQLRAVTRVQRRAARTPAATRPNATPSPIAPAATPSPLQSVSSAAAPAPAPVATPAPGSTVVKTRGRGTAPSKVDVPKQRVNKPAKPAPAPPPPSSNPTPGPSPRSSAPESAPPAATELRPVRPGRPPAPGVGAADGVLHRVPPGHR